ncbi:type I secretion system permease/ATPase [Pseudovibrio exalbescens]|uniref:type I secretion system permease/ATPase n=1 Tax=Pseudovibrio exalbescens TaxID=197461 RepID=UPI00236657A9|nr:type I secretion system permease/ATPase [Pseudovibrio exalbescens]MDD7908847.1 type I secretion system permease/ATPase [Pseudovibrio exalbescens]
MLQSVSRRSKRSPITEAFKSCRSAYLSIGAISLVINLLMLTGPIFMLQIYDRVLSSASVPTLIVIAVFAGVLYVFFALLEGIRARSLNRVSQEIDAQLSAASYAASLKLPLRLGAQGKNVDPVRDLETMRQFWGGQGPSAIFDVPWMPVYLAIVFALHFWLGVLALAGAVVILALVIANELLSREPSRALSMMNGQRSGFVNGTRRNAEVIRAMGMNQTLVEQWQRSNEDYYDVQSKAADRQSFFATVIKALRFILQSAVLGVGAWLAIKQEVSPGVMIAASIITSRALAPVEQAVAHWRGFLASRQSRTRLEQALQAMDEEEPQTELPLPKDNLAVENLATAAPGEKVLTFKGATFQLRAGDGLGVIGPSGSGKTSMIRALIGVWPILRGSVRFDGAEPNQWSEERLGAAIGYLPQDVELFDGSIADNIARFSAQRQDEDVLRAARMANVHDLITSLPDGYDTQVGDGGARLSAGQRQRIGLARALYGEPFLVVLDEPNSNLDSEGEAALMEAIKALREKGSIVIVVAHRPSAIATVDYLLVIKEGQQVAFGPKDEVLQKVGASVGKPAPVGAVAHDRK